ncbi:MAG: 4-hydroxy-tetrahydrodipicolinate reductase [Myxococcota bacterium]
MGIELIVSGAAGRLGQRVVALAAASPDLNVVGALVRAGSAASAQPSASTALEPLLKRGRVLVEMAPRPVALEHARQAAEAGVAVLVATTGFSPAERAEIEGLGAKVPVLLAANLSMGVAVLTELVRQASAALPGFDLELVEIHHNQKKDAPSGTAWALARAAAEARGQNIDDDAILARAGDVGARGKREIGIQSLRGGNVIGEHTLYLIGGSERLELSHRAQTRDVFAEGALVAARFLGTPGRAAQPYTMRDVLQLGGP